MSEFNFSAVIIGPPSSGKTTIVRGIVDQHLRTHATGRAFVHDPNRQLRDLCATYDDIAAWRKAIEANGTEKPFPRGASVGGSSQSLTEAVIAIGKQWNTAGNVRAPILLAYDESSLMETSGPTHMHALDTQLLSNRRHWGIGTVYNVQRATALTEAFYTMATDVYILTQPSESRTSKLEEYLGLAHGALRELVAAPPFEFKHWQAGKGLI